MMTTHKTWIEIDSKALLANLEIFRLLLPKEAVLLTMIKANAYGHGLGEVSDIIAKSKIGKTVLFGVDSFDEAMALKSRGIKNQIVILGYIPLRLLSQALYNKFHISVFNRETLEHVNRILDTAHAHPAPRLHFKVETGLNRLGFSPEILKELRVPSLEGIYTHFANVEDAESDFYKSQLTKFEEARVVLAARGVIPRYVHTASTAALMQYPETHYSLARLGIGLYGLSPLSRKREMQFSSRLTHLLAGSDATQKIAFPAIRSVLSWKTRIAHIAAIKKGDSVGYDRTFVADKDTRIAVLPIGYADGFDRGLSNKGSVLIGGAVAPVIGRVSMNMTVVDISSADTAVGDEVVLIGTSKGKEISAGDIAELLGTIHYEVVARINPLIPRIII